MRTDEELREAAALMSDEDIANQLDELMEWNAADMHEAGIVTLNAAEVEWVLKVARDNGTTERAGFVSCLQWAGGIKQPPRDWQWAALMDGDLLISAPGEGKEVVIERRKKP